MAKRHDGALERLRALAPAAGVWATVQPMWGAAQAYIIQFNGVADAAASLGTIGAVIMPESVSSASTRLAAGACDYVSKINGASLMGLESELLGPYGVPITEAYLGVVGRTAPYTLKNAGTVLAATPEMVRLTWAAEANVGAIRITEYGPMNWAGTPGTGSARFVIVTGLVKQ